MVYSGKSGAHRRKSNVSINGYVNRNERINKARLVVCLWIIFAVTAVKLIPGCEDIRHRLLYLVTGNVDYMEAISVLGEAAKGDRELTEAISDACGYAFSIRSNEDSIPVHEQIESGTEQVMLNENGIEPENKNGVFTGVSAMETYPDPEQYTPYADLPLPENVSYDRIDGAPEFLFPVSGSVTSKFGYREDPSYGAVRFHYGTDIFCAADESVKSCCDGTVLAVAESSKSGNYVIISHNDGWKTMYANLSKVSVRQGQYVTAGDEIGVAGYTDGSENNFMHLELMHDGTYFDPEKYILP